MAKFLVIFLTLLYATANVIANEITSVNLKNNKKELHHMLIDPRNGNLYLTATNTLYVRYDDLQPIEKVSLGPRNDSELCSPNPEEGCACENGTAIEDCTAEDSKMLQDTISKALTLDTAHNTLIICSNLNYGYCFKVFLDNYLVNHSYLTPVVFNSLLGNAVLLVVHNKIYGDQLLVAATRNISVGVPSFKDKAHMLSRRRLDNFDLTNFDIGTSAPFLDVKAQLRDVFPVMFEYGFSYGNYSYFLGVRRRSNSSEEVVSFLVRICNNENSLRSYTELQLECGSYSRITSATVAMTGSKLALAMARHNTKPLIFALFVRGRQGWGVDVPTDTSNSALCLFSLEEVEKQVDGAVKICFSGIGNTGPTHITEPRPCRLKEYVFCGEDDQNWPLSGLQLISNSAIYALTHRPGAYPTTIAVKTSQTLDGNHTLVYMGTNDGSLQKAILVDKVTITIFSSQNLGGGLPIKKNLAFSRDKNRIYAFTKRKVVLASTYNCSAHTTCDQCLSSGDPHCGWCGLQNACTDFEGCELTHHALGWLNFPERQCPVVISVFPDEIIQYQTNLTTVRLRLSHVPELSADRINQLHVQCALLGPDWSPDSGRAPGARDYRLVSDALVVDNSDVTCQPFHIPPPLPAGITSELSHIALVVGERQWLSASLTLYNCENHVSCGACTQREMACVWCLKSNRCVNRREQCDNQAAITSEKTPPTGTSADRIGPEFCPKIVGVGAYSTRADVPITVEVAGRELLDYHQNGLRCHFDHKTGVVVNGSWVGDKVICEAISLSYDGDVGEISVPLSVLWDGNKTLDNPENVAISVYKCAYLGRSCGECTLLDLRYGCGWCEDHCSARTECTGGKQWLDKFDICRNPQILDFEPKAGPHLGGTNVVITGVNLGKTVADIKDGVKVGGRKCKVLQDQYIPSRSIMCVTGGLGYETEDIVEVTVGGHADVIARTTETFKFKDPIMVSFVPKQGPVAGGTAVTVKGQDLDLGNAVRVSMNNRLCTFVSKSSREIVFITAAQDAPIAAKIKLNFDEIEENVLGEAFRFLANPLIAAVNTPDVLASGGTVLTLVGENFYPAMRATLTLRPATRLGDNRRARRHAGVKVETSEPTPRYGLSELNVPCSYSSEEALHCPLPSLTALATGAVGDVPALLEYDVTVDAWRMSEHGSVRPGDLEYEPIRVYENPRFDRLGGVVDYISGMTFDISGENLHVLRKVRSLQVFVGNTSCHVTDIQRDVITVEAPAEPRLINADGNAEVLVKVGSLEVPVGFIKYSSGEVPPKEENLLLGVIIGSILVFLLLVVIGIFVVRRRRRSRKSALPMRAKNGSLVEARALQRPLTGTLDASGPPPAPERTQNVEGGVDLAAESIPLKAYTDEQQGSGEEDEEDAAEQQKPFELADFLAKLSDPKLRENVREVIVPPERLETKEMIGRGNFGCVYLAILKGSQDENYKNNCRVAVKTLQGERLEQATVESFLKEGVIMKNFNHPHVLKLLGVCVTNHENPMVILPYMSNGDLRSYVKDKKKNFTARQLLHLAQQVAEGMAYLSSLNCVHRDLAARNCMIDEFDEVKVADFGLTRDLLEKQYFSTNLKEKRGKMPIKWMAIESLEEFVFTTKSDVWSFGVLMWELMTRGVTPYPDVDIFDVRNYLASGRRLRKPKYCPENIYKIMLDCWHADPDIRPSFIDLVNRIELLLNPPRKRISEELEPMYMNITKANSTEYLRPTDTPGFSEA